MNERVASAAVLLGLVLVLTAPGAGLIGCGPNDSATATTTAPQTSAQAGLGQTPAAKVTTTTSSPEPAGLSSAVLEAAGTSLEEYRAEMFGFAQALSNLPAEDDPSEFTDVAAVTSERLEAAKEYVSGIHNAVAQLKAIQPPAEIADAHREVVVGIETLAATTDELMIATEDKDQAAFDAALAEGQAAVEALQASMEALASLLGDTTP